MQGYLLTIYVSEVLNFLLSFRQLRKSVGLWLPFYRSVLAPVLAAMWGIFLPRLLWPAFCRESLLLAACLSAVIYYSLLRLLGSVTRRDLQWFAGIFRQK